MEDTNTSDLYDQSKSKTFYENRYISGYMETWPIEREERLLDVIAHLDLPVTGKALDFGCGNGVLTEVIRQALPSWKVYGTDISNKAINKEEDTQFLKLVRDITSKGFVRSNYKKKLIDLTDVRINLKSKK